MMNGFRQGAAPLAMSAAMMLGLAGPAAAVDPGVGVGKPGPGVTRGVGAPGVGVADPGINQPGRAGNVGRDPGINQPGRAGNVGAGVGVTPGVGVGAPGVGVVDPGLNQPGVAGNVGGVARRSVRR